MKASSQSGVITLKPTCVSCSTSQVYIPKIARKVPEMCTHKRRVKIFEGTCCFYSIMIYMPLKKTKKKKNYFHNAICGCVHIYETFNVSAKVRLSVMAVAQERHNDECKVN